MWPDLAKLSIRLTTDAIQLELALSQAPVLWNQFIN